MTITSEERSDPPEHRGFELLIKEARAASRRRRLGWCIVFIVFALVTTLIVASTVGNSKPTRQIGVGIRTERNALAILPCTSTGVSISNGPLVSEAQEEEAHLLTITNVSSKSCLMSGFPRLVVYGLGCGDPISLGAPPTADFH